MIHLGRLTLPLTDATEYGTGVHHLPDPSAIDAAGLIEGGELEPYRDLLADYLGRHERSYDIDTVIAYPATYNLTVPRFFRWLTVIHPDRLTVPQGNSEPAAARPVLPRLNDGSEWGPSHPEWAGWWERARTLAERFGYGSQYDALAEQLGGPARVSYDTVTVTITFPIETDQPVTPEAVRAALTEQGFVTTDRRPR